MAGYTAADVARFRKLSDEKKLSTRDRKFIESFGLSPEEIMADELQSVTPASIKELEAAIAGAKSPDIRAVLVAEHANVKKLIQKHYPEVMAESQPPAKPPTASGVSIETILQAVRGFFNQ